MRYGYHRRGGEPADERDPLARLWGPEDQPRMTTQSMHIAPHDRRILIYAKLTSDRAENAFPSTCGDKRHQFVSGSQ